MVFFPVEVYYYCDSQFYGYFRKTIIFSIMYNIYIVSRRWQAPGAVKKTKQKNEFILLILLVFLMITYFCKIIKELRS